MPTAIIVESDTHGGHKLGLCNPGVVLENDEGGVEKVSLGVYQDYIWRLREWYIQKCMELVGNRRVIYFHGGDCTQGLRFFDGLMTTRLSDQFEIAQKNMEPVIDRTGTDTIRIISGTSVHSFGEGSAERMVARYLRAKYPDKDIKSVPHALMRVEDVVIDFSHHGPGAGIRRWTRGNQARYYLKSLMMQEYADGRKPARLYIRGHYHTFVHETNREMFNGRCYESDIIVLPSWCGMTEHARKATHSQHIVENGLLLLLIDGEDVKVIPMVKTLDARVTEEL